MMAKIYTYYSSLILEADCKLDYQLKVGEGLWRAVTAQIALEKKAEEVNHTN